MTIISKLAKDSRVSRCIEAFDDDVDEIVQLAIDIQQIPAPTFSERDRANFIEERFNELELVEVHQDHLHNVFACIKGDGSATPLVVSAHLDTVFPSATDLSIGVKKNKDGQKYRVYGPGIADNALGTAGLIVLAKALLECDLPTNRDIWFVANIGEEGLGNLKGMRAVVDRFGEVGVYIVLEGGSYGNIFHRAIGVRRFKIEVSAAGGHSWGDFGTPSAIHELGKIVAEISELPVPNDPKTSFNIGVIEGGTSVNTIAASASCLLDLRSIDKRELESLTLAVKSIIDSNDQDPTIEVSMSEIGSRPSGVIDKKAVPVNYAFDALQHVGCEEISFLAGSTDANIPISLGYPAVCIGLANAGNTHRLDEYFETKNLPNGLSQLLLVTLAAAGYLRSIDEF